MIIVYINTGVSLRNEYLTYGFRYEVLEYPYNNVAYDMVKDAAYYIRCDDGKNRWIESEYFILLSDFRDGLIDVF